MLEFADTKCHHLQCLKIAFDKAHPRYRGNDDKGLSSLSYGVEIIENTEIVYVCVIVFLNFVRWNLTGGLVCLIFLINYTNDQSSNSSQYIFHFSSEQLTSYVYSCKPC